jgi:16S rRNA processing protein RimM
MSRQQDDYVIVGRVSGVYGVNGWVKVFSHTDPRDNITRYNPWYLDMKGEWQPHEVEQGKAHGKTVVAKLKGIDDRDVAAMLAGHDIAIRREQMAVLEQGDYYWSDLIGLQVETPDGTPLGIVDKLMETGANDVLVVRQEGKQHLIPYIKGQVIQNIDLEQGLITAAWDPDF